MGARRPVRTTARAAAGAGLALGALVGVLGPGQSAVAATPAGAASSVTATGPTTGPAATAGSWGANGVDPAALEGELEGELDALLERQLTEYDIPGASVVVVAGGREVLARGYGTADLADDTPVDPAETGFFMGSVGKVLTATAVLQQVEEGRIDLDEDVNTYLADSDAADGFAIEDGWDGRPVTVGQLLTHTAGFADAILGRGAARPEDAGELGESLADHQPERVRPPGEVAVYDNYALALAGRLVEIVSGQPFDAYVRDRVFEPLGMADSSLAQPAPGPIAERLAVGYRPDGDGQTVVRGQYGAWSPSGAGAVATARDMGRLLLALLNGGAVAGVEGVERVGEVEGGDGGADAGRVLAADSVAAMTGRRFANDERLPGLGYVLEERPHGAHRTLVKDGDLPGFHTNLALLPDADVGVWVAYNGDGEDGRAWWAGQEVEDLVAEHVLGAPPGPEAVADDGERRADHGAESGFYRSARTSRADLTRAAALTTAIEVTVHDDGTLTTHGPATRDPDVDEQRWVPVGDGVYQQEDGRETLAFDDGRLLLGAFPSAAWERLDWYESPVLHQVSLAVALAVLLLSVLYWTARAALPSWWRRDGGAGPPSARVALALGWLTGGLVSAAAVCFALLVADGNRMNEAILLDESALLHAVPPLLTVAAVTTLGTVVCAALAWPARWWGPVARVHYGVVALASLGTLLVAGLYNLVP